MDQKILNDAAENISLIKGIIEKTSKSFSSFSKIFIYWGLLFLVYSGIAIFRFLNESGKIMKDQQSAISIYLLVIGIFGVITAVIYLLISKRTPLVGLEKSLMKIWVLTLIMNVIPIKVGFDIPPVEAGDSAIHQFVMIQTNSFFILFFSLAIALILTSFLTDFKQPKLVGFVYIFIGILYVVSYSPRVSMYPLQYFQVLVLPFTFLYLGIFLKSKKVRGDSIGD